MNNLDDKIKKALENRTQITGEDVRDVWNKIDMELNFNRKKEGKKMKSKNRGLIPFIGAAAAVAILFVSLQTNVGHAIVSQIKELFAPQKEIVQEIEGNKEKTDVHLHQPKESNYIIYVDEERYEFIEGEDRDKIVMKDKPDNIPEVSMEIKQVKDKYPEEVIKDIEAQLKEEYEIVHGPERVTEPLEGFTIRALTGQQWDSKVIKFYVISNENQGSFIITQRYFLEAAEGHGVRFDEMLKEFKIIEE
ncbi:MAG: hypothetical protein GXY88_01405 [Tissierellia bacterium]|nr:hypothetical protein [Tissierellia bacterium]